MTRPFGSKKFRKAFGKKKLKEGTSRKDIILHCTECDSPDHNIRSCPQAAERQRRNRHKLKEIKGRGRP